MIETTAFRLAAGADELDFLAADKRAQAEFFYQQPGLVRRTTARGDRADWVSIVVWQSDADADVAAARAADDPAAKGLAALIDPASVEIRRYRELD